MFQGFWGVGLWGAVFLDKFSSSWRCREGSLSGLQDEKP